MSLKSLNSFSSDEVPITILKLRSPFINLPLNDMQPNSSYRSIPQYVKTWIY